MAILVHTLAMFISSVETAAKNLPIAYISRRLHPALLDSLSEPEVTVLYGARQVGKSVEVFSCIRDLLKQSPKADVFYFNLDFPSPDFSHPDAFVNAIVSQKQNQKSPTYIFLDEAQRLPNVGLFVKYIYDQKLNFKFVLTGSASLDIKQKIKEPLTGRKQEFTLLSLTLDEILAFKKIKLDQIGGDFSLLQLVLGEYLLFGGYPAVVTALSFDKKVARLREIADSYIQKDLATMFGLTDVGSIRLVASYLAESIGNLLSVDALSQLAGLPKNQVQKIILALEKTFVVTPLYPFFKDRAKELTHRPKIYFNDIGIRNAVLGKLDEALIVAEKGQLFENAIATQLLSLYGPQKIKYWRTTNQTEVDFIVEKSFNKLLLFEAKYTWDSSKTAKNVASFHDTYRSLLVGEKIISKENYWEVYTP